jgi:predicted PurR-regulated permease PerM
MGNYVNGLMRLVQNKKILSATLITLFILAVLIVPTVIFIDILIENIINLAGQLKDDAFKIPPPPESRVCLWVPLYWR